MQEARWGHGIGRVEGQLVAARREASGADDVGEMSVGWCFRSYYCPDQPGQSRPSAAPPSHTDARYPRCMGKGPREPGLSAQEGQG